MVVGGYTLHHYQATGRVLSYDPVANSWKKLKDMGTKRSNFAIGRLNDGRIIVAGGQGTDRGALSTAEVYNPVANTWTDLPNMTKNHSYSTIQSGAVASDNRFYAIGTQAWMSMQIYDPAANAWSIVSLVSSKKVFPRSYACLVAAGPDIFLVGTQRDAKLQAAVLSGQRFVKLPAECAESFACQWNRSPFTGVFAEKVDASAAAFPLADITTVPAEHEAFEDLKFVLAEFVSKHLLEPNDSDDNPDRTVVFKRTAMITSQPMNVGGGSDSLTLLPHQLVGLNWLWLLYQNKLSGVVNDEMGNTTCPGLVLHLRLLAQGRMI